VDTNGTSHAADGESHRRVAARLRFALTAMLSALLLAVLCGCAGPRHATLANPRPFAFETDTFDYANELVWEYYHDDLGKWTSRRREPRPDYTHHCFVVARSARQFFQHARFDAAQPVRDELFYRDVIRRVVALDPRRALPETEKIVIPGYANLREFSDAHEDLLKAECGGAWRSYFQRGHWRIIFPFTRRHQARMAEHLAGDIDRHLPPVVHLVRFPQLTINHALLLFDAEQTADEIRFAAYDPNHPEQPATLTFDRASRTFLLSANPYFPGGRVDVYEIYRSLVY
jgi:hypothetical protein